MSYYDERAQNVDLNDRSITSSDNNAEILQMLRDDDPDLSDRWITQDQHNLDVLSFFREAMIWGGWDISLGGAQCSPDFSLPTCLKIESRLLHWSEGLAEQIH